MNRAPLNRCARIAAWHAREWLATFYRRGLPRHWRHDWRALHAAQIRSIVETARRGRCDGDAFTWCDALAFLVLAAAIDGGLYLVLRLVMS